MTSLESSVTLEDIFSVVEGKRVPLAPELAGYLTLEVADGSQATGGDVDPRTVYVSEAGTVALVRTKKQAPEGDAESSVRGILAKLLEASGSSTPALTAAARRAASDENGLRGLVSELEAALIPVNRAAGRRALARLAREVKRVTLGVGRNASVPPPSQALAEGSGPLGPVTRRSAASFTDEALTAKRAQQLASEQLDADAQRASAAFAQPPSSPLRGGSPEVDMLFGGDEVDSLLSSFEVSGVGENQLRTNLKAIAGVDATPGPPDAATLGEWSKGVHRASPKGGESDSVDALLALVDSSREQKEIEPPSRSVATLSPPAPLASLPPPPPRSPLAPLSPLVPMIPSSPARGASDLERPATAPPPRIASNAAPMTGALKRPATPRPRSAPVAVASAAASNRRHRSGGAQAVPSTARKPLPPAPPKTTDRTFRQPQAPRSGLALSLLTVAVLFAGGIAVWTFKPAFFTGKRRAAAVAASSGLRPVPSAAPRCKVTLVVTDVPTSAEILLRVGQAPLDVERMPVGTRLEFVSTAEGYAPRRAVVKADAPWEKAPDGKPRIDVPIQLDPTKAKGTTVDPWPAAEPGSQVGGSGSPGSVHIVSNVRGAEVWLLAGLGPEARIEQLRCDADIDVLIAGPPQLRKRLHVSEKELQAESVDLQGNRVVSISAK